MMGSEKAQSLPVEQNQISKRDLGSVLCFSFSLAAREPMAYVRIIAPLRHLGISIINGLHGHEPIERLIQASDVVLIQREFPVKFAEYEEIMKIAKQKNKPVIFDLDDLLFFLPEDHPDREDHYYALALLPMLQTLMEADLVTVSTPLLRDVLIEYNDNIVVLPNYLDDKIWTIKAINSPNYDQKNITIGYMGTRSHEPDLEYVAPVLFDLLQRYPQLRIRIWGMEPPSELQQSSQVEWTSSFLSSYEDFVAFFQNQSADIFIAPLRDNLFNRCKSPLKFLEYSAMGAPGVFSRLEPYTSVVQHGYNGLLAYSLEEWEECLVQLIEDQEKRHHLALNAQKTLQAEWLLSANAFRWEEVLQNVVTRAKINPKITHFLGIFRSINEQVLEKIHALEAHLEDLRAENRHLRWENERLQEEQRRGQQELDHLRAENQRLQQEIVGYVLSKSWQMTRPIRLIGRKIRKWWKGEADD